MWIIFTFVGLWHDLWCARTPRMYMASNLNARHDRWRWLAWAWINCVCFSLEIVFGQWFFAEGKRPDGSSRGSGIRRTIRSSRYYRLIAAMAATCNIMYVTSHFLNARNAARAFVILAILVALVFATISIMITPTTAIISPTNHTDFLIYFCSGLAFVSRHLLELLPISPSIFSPLSLTLPLRCFRRIAPSCTDSPERSCPAFLLFLFAAAIQII